MNNHTQQKGFVGILIILLVLVAVGMVGYFLFVKKEEMSSQYTNTTTSNTVAKTTENQPAIKNSSDLDKASKDLDDNTDSTQMDNESNQLNSDSATL